MGVYRVNFSEADLSNRRLMTANQVLAEFSVWHGRARSSVLRLRHPVSVVTVGRDELTRTRHAVKLAPDLFRLLDQCARDDQMIVSLGWRGVKLGPHGLYALNAAVRTAALKKGGRNIVRHWLEDVKGSIIPTRSQFKDLLDFLEVRPISTSTVAHNPNMVSIM